MGLLDRDRRRCDFWLDPPAYFFQSFISFFWWRWRFALIRRRLIAVLRVVYVGICEFLIVSFVSCSPAFGPSHSLDSSCLTRSQRRRLTD